MGNTSNTNDEKLGIWKAGVWLARKMRLPLKLGIICATLIVPLLILATTLIQRQVEDIRLAQSELQGTAVIRPVVRVLAAVQKHRGQTNMLLSGNAAVMSELDKTRAEIGRAVGEGMAAMQAATGHFDVSARWAPLQERLQRLPAETQSAKGPASFRLHSELVRDLGQFVYFVADQSGLLFDPEPVPYLLMDLAVSRMPPWSEQLAQLRGSGAGLLARTEPDAVAESAILGRLSMLDTLLSDERFALDTLGQRGEKLEKADAALAASARFTAHAADAFGPANGKPRDPVAYFGAGTAAINAILAVQDETLGRLEGLLSQRLRDVTTLRNSLLAGCVAGMLMLAYLLTTFYKSLMIDVRRMGYAMKELASGNLRVAGSLRSRDEIGELAFDLNRMINNVSTMVAAVGSTAALVAHAGRNQSAGNRDLSDRTEQQAANLEQTSASVQELATTVARNADTAGHVDQQAAKVRDIAESGAQAMTTSVQAVEAIQKSAQRMNEIIGVIDGLAFQTNILALNAAVEAARAGDSGRGFAVVASEVRTLAQRSAESSREIRKLIQTSSAQVESSVTQIRSAGEAMSRIVTGIREVSGSITQISGASAEQSLGIREISSAVRQLDEITQSNARMVEEAVSESNRLEAQAGSLTAAIGQFKLRQGVAQEAMNLVERARDFRPSCPTREAFLRALTDGSNGFHDRDMYVFVLDARGTYLAFGGNAAKVGTRVQDVPGIDGDGLTQAIVQQCGVGPGWVEYDITNPSTGRVQSKMSYVQPLDGVYLGCGVYKSLA